MKRFLILVSLMMLGIFSTVTPADLAVMNPDDIEDVTYAQQLKELKDAAAVRATALKDAAAARASALKEAGKSAAGTAWRGIADTGVPFATTTDVVGVIPGETVVSPYEMDESMGGYFAPRTYRKIPERRFGLRRNVTVGEAGEAIGSKAKAGYYGAMAGLDAGVDAADRGVRALGRGAQRGYYGAMAGLDAGVDAAGRGVRAAGRGVQRGWRGFVNTGVPGTTVTYSDFPEAMGEWPETVERQRRMRIGEVPGAVKAGAQRGWRGFVDTGVPLTGVTEYSMSPYEMDESMGGYFAPRRQVATQRRRTFGEVGEAIRGGAEAGIGAAGKGANYLGRGVAGSARAAYGVGAKGAGYVGRGVAGGAGYVGRGISNIPVLGTTATEYSMSPYEMNEAYGGYFAPRQQIKTERRKTLGETFGGWYDTVRNKFGSKK